MRLNRFDPIIFWMCVVATGLFAFAMIVHFNSDPEAEKVRTAVVSQDRLVTISPREGVECYILAGSSSTNSRVMSCVVLPQDEECM